MPPSSSSNRPPRPSVPSSQLPGTLPGPNPYSAVAHFAAPPPSASQGFLPSPGLHPHYSPSFVSGHGSPFAAPPPPPPQPLQSPAAAVAAAAAAAAAGNKRNMDPMDLSGSLHNTTDPALTTTDPALTAVSAPGPVAMTADMGGPMSAGTPQSMSGMGAASGPEDGSAAPPAKRTRTNTPWTAAEEKRLKILRDEGKSWNEIAKDFPNRTEGSVKKHWYKDMHYAEFGEDESDALLEAIRDYDASKWKVIGQKVGKPAKACEQYAKEHFQGKI